MTVYQRKEIHFERSHTQQQHHHQQQQRSRSTVRSEDYCSLTGPVLLVHAPCIAGGAPRKQNAGRLGGDWTIAELRDSGTLERRCLRFQRLSLTMLFYVL